MQPPHLHLCRKSKVLLLNDMCILQLFISLTTSVWKLQVTNLELGFPAHVTHVITPDSFLFNTSLLEMDTRMMEVCMCTLQPMPWHLGPILAIGKASLAWNCLWQYHIWKLARFAANSVCACVHVCNHAHVLAIHGCELQKMYYGFSS